jgi:transmembrane sensor
VTNIPPWELISRKLSGRASLAELTQLERWLDEDPRRGPEFAELQRRWSASPRVAVDAEDRWPSVRQKMTQQSVPQTPAGRYGSLWRPSSPQSTLHRLTPSRRQFAGSFVALAIVVVTGGTLLLTRPSVTSPRATTPTTYTTASGQQAVVTLADGSQARLGPATTVVVSHNASTGTTVKVTGQALFTVAHHARSPFVVHAGMTITRVLGTQFLVRKYVDDRVSRVVVADGRVAFRNLRRLSKQDSGIVLSAGMAATSDDSGHTTVDPSITVDDYTAWARGRLIFRQTLAHDIVADLGRAYGVEIQIADSALNRRAFTWTVSVAQLTLEDALRVLTAALSAHAVRTGNVITIVPGPSASRKSVNPRFPLALESQYGR